VVEGRLAGVTVIHGDALQLLPTLALDRAGTFIYADPPYVRSVRRAAFRPIYRHELTDAQHRDLLSLLTAMRTCAVMISGYRSKLYDQVLAHWRRIDFRAMTRGGPAIESVWINYAPPKALHDYSHLGKNFRERERIKRKRARWVARLAAMPELERACIREALDLVASPAPAGLEQRSA
jgi:hypothetical protein